MRAKNELAQLGKERSTNLRRNLLEASYSMKFKTHGSEEQAQKSMTPSRTYKVSLHAKIQQCKVEFQACARTRSDPSDASTNNLTKKITE